jgi:hypothetical protein
MSDTDNELGQEYDRLALLEDLESLLEEIEEQGVTGDGDWGRLAADTREQLVAYGVHDVQQLRTRIMHLHAEIDDDERDMEITES